MAKIERFGDKHVITLVKGDSFSARLEIRDEDGNSYEFEPGDEVWFQMKERESSTMLFYRAEVPQDTMILEIPASIMERARAKKYIFDVHLEMNGDRRETFLRGVVNVLHKVEGRYGD